MKKRIKFEPQQFISVIVEVIASAFLISSGVSVEQANLIGKSLGGMTEGISLSDDNTVNTILSSIERAVANTLDVAKFEITDDCRRLLKENSFSPEKFIEFMCETDSHIYLKKQIIEICERDPDFDLETFLLDDFVASIIENFEMEVLKHPELASYATYCILRKTTSHPGIHCANQQYVDSFTETLFLHRKSSNSRVNLANLFVLQKCEVLNKEENQSQDDTNDAKKNIKDVLSQYLQKPTIPFLFIEGDAGCGKTSLVAWMNYHYSFRDDVAAELFAGRPLITIRLRDLDKKDISQSGSLSLAIRNYMNISSLDDLEQLFPNAIMILDGFDELCMIEGMANQHDYLLYDLWQKKLNGFQFIVTTRPKFISYNIDIRSKYISLKHLDSKKREEWLEKYTSTQYCGQVVDGSIYEYIMSIDDDENSCICDTAMTLYMLVAKKDTEVFLENNWALYHHIFFEELSETEYNKMIPDPDRNYSHDINRLRDILYQISEEIAYRMYQRENKSFYLSDGELSSIIEELSDQHAVLKNMDTKSIVERCYGLCCYWKANSDRGVVEFLHNNIRDFFLAEKICRVMDDLIQSIQQNKNSENYKLIVNRLCTLFQYNVLETKVTEFIFLRFKYKAEKNEFDFAQYEYSSRLIGKIISDLSRNGIIDSNVLIERSDINPFQKIVNILTCTVQLYRHAYEVYLEEKEYINWVSESHIADDLLIPLFRTVFHQLPVTISYDNMITLGSRSYFKDIDFSSCDLRNIGFENSKLVYVNFSNTILCGCDFSNAELIGCDFSDADVHYACFEDAKIENCNMTRADLRGTELPDGFISPDQDEQINHLKSLQIPELTI